MIDLLRNMTNSVIAANNGCHTAVLLFAWGGYNPDNQILSNYFQAVEDHAGSSISSIAFFVPACYSCMLLRARFLSHQQACLS